MKFFLLFLISINAYSIEFVKTNGTRKFFNNKEKEIFSNKIIKMSNIFVKEAKKRNVFIKNPYKKYKFGLLSEDFHFDGHCVDNIILLKKDFNKRVFFHELGHCEFKYSHSFDHQIEKIKNKEIKKVSSIMSWVVSESQEKFISKNWNILLDDFFNQEKNNKIYSKKGILKHAEMITRIKLYYYIQDNNLKNELDYHKSINELEKYYFIVYQKEYKNTKKGRILIEYGDSFIID